MSYWDDNIAILKERYPELAQRVLENPLTLNLKTVKAQDGLCAYGFLKAGNVLQPVTNPVNPGEKINRKLDEWRKEIQNFTRPILVIGFNPGIEVQMLFEYRENQSGNYCKQPLWICIDSIFTFYGFLRTYDAGKLLTSSRVELFWHEEMPKRVEWLRRHPEFSYLFTLFSLSSHDIQERILNPLVKLAQERQKAVDRYTVENEAYYENLSDEELARIVRGQGGRPPRLLVPSCSWSTVIQYSIRDTCEALNQRGWETRILNSPAMLTPHYVIESVHDFKPDVFLYVDHLRTEVAEVLPRNLMLMTWVQDTLPYINSVETASKWNKQVASRNRDIIFGYVKQLEPYGYEQKRLYPLNMVVNTAIFRPKELTDAEREKYACDVCFASNRGLPTQRVLDENLVDLFEPYGITKEQLQKWHDELWEHYRSGESLVSYQQLINFLELDGSPDDNWVQLLFWRLNDIIYRHTVIEWLDEYAQEHPDFKINLYGQGWSEHPQFAKYACGEIEHGKDLSTAYQAAKYCLHLNALEGMHQRVTEIVAAGGHIITRIQYKENRQPEVLTSAYRKLFLRANKKADEKELSGDEIKALHQNFFSSLQKLITENPECTLEELEIKAVEFFNVRLKGTLLTMLDAWEPHVFSSRESFFQFLDIQNISSLAAKESLGQTRRMLQTHADDMQQILQEALPFEDVGKQQHASASPYPDFLNMAKSLFALQLDDKQDSKSAFCAVQYPFLALYKLIISYLVAQKDYVGAVAFLNVLDITEATEKELLLYATYYVYAEQDTFAEEYVERAYAKNSRVMDGYINTAWTEYHKENRRDTQIIKWLKKDECLGRISTQGKHKQLIMEMDIVGDSEILRNIRRRYNNEKELNDEYSYYGWQKYVVNWKYQFDKALPFLQRDYDARRQTMLWGLNYAQALAGCMKYRQADEVINSIYLQHANAYNGYACCALQRWNQRGYRLDEVIDVFNSEMEKDRLSSAYKEIYALLLAINGQWSSALGLLDSLEEQGKLTLGFFQTAWNYYAHHYKTEPDFDWEYYYDLDLGYGLINPQKELLYPAMQLLSGKTVSCIKIDDIYKRTLKNEAIFGYTLLACYDYLVNKDPVRSLSLIKRDIQYIRLPGFYQWIYAGFLYQVYGEKKVSSYFASLSDVNSLSSWLAAQGWVHRIGYDWKIVDRILPAALRKFIE